MWIFDANKGQRVGSCVGYNDEKERIKKNTNNYVIIYLLLMIMIHFGDMKEDDRFDEETSSRAEKIINKDENK